MTIKYCRTCGQPISDDSDLARLIELVTEVSAQVFHTNATAIKTGDRKPRNVMARQLAWAVLRELTPMSTTEIGAWFQRDHTTVMAGIKRAHEIDVLFVKNWILTKHPDLCV